MGLERLYQAGYRTRNFLKCKKLVFTSNWIYSALFSFLNTRNRLTISIIGFLLLSRGKRTCSEPLFDLFLVGNTLGLPFRES